MVDKKAIHDRICAEIHEMYIKKNADYGDSVGELYKKLGDVSFLTRISDKYHRLMNLMTDYDGYMREDREINYESIDDTIQDLANYCIIWLMERELKRIENAPKIDGSFITTGKLERMQVAPMQAHLINKNNKKGE